MAIKTRTSQDAKQEREALMKHLADLPLSPKLRGKTPVRSRKGTIATTEPATVANEA